MSREDEGEIKIEMKMKMKTIEERRRRRLREIAGRHKLKRAAIIHHLSRRQER